ncbi:cupredoxin domain-containing protein [Leptothrix discophora]|uniref:Laccase n=1 Tax=Leptothrix discophora TaxID=89 RepID=A0ABT9G8L0_LEPDI|nr:hypothetical protein [Leptothrix discophora]MDP4302523.1 hypothetical protein [Leptothrix discophora]
MAHSKQAKKSIAQPFVLATSVRATLMAMAAMTAAPIYAGVGFGESQDVNGNYMAVRSHFAHSPRGDRDSQTPEAVAEANTLHAAGKFTGTSALDTGKALRKFIDPLPLPGVERTLADGVTTRTLPVAKAAKWVNPQTGAAGTDDYYEIAVVEFKQKLHSDLKNPTTLRGYVQIDHEATNGRTPLPGSKSFALTYPDGSAIQIQATDAKGFLVFNADGSRQMVPALAVEQPHMYGPVLQARKGTPTRVKFVNLMPAGRAETTVGPDGKTVVLKRNGDLFLPVDKSIAHAGLGPDGFTEFTQNRTNIHLHGGDTPWISDGTPHQWITPLGESLPRAAGSNAPAPLVDQGIDAQYLPAFLRGASAQNVPDMPDPGPGAMTYYFPNGQSGRMLWYHDHTIGITRLNVYSGMASVYMLGDEVDDALVNGGTVGATSLQKVLPPAERTLPLVFSDRTFVPADVALQDAKWNASAWGSESDSWFPHVYETVQDPAQMNGFNAVGRWHWGPLFWPVFPAMYDLPTGEYGDVTTTPEAWMDTPLINGVAYPTLDVDPTTYRFKILNASNDRFITVNMFVADENVSFEGRNTELKMVPAAQAANVCAAGETRSVGGCVPELWPTDNRAGGVPDPTTQGPTMYQIASEGGLLPAVAKYDPVPINYNMDKGRITVLNVDTTALYLGNAERADVVVDFSQYAGKTLIVYNDSGAPVPAGDPRNDYYTDVGDQSTEGGAENTKVGHGPNTRTMMMIKVRAAADAVAINGDITLDPAKLATELPKAYALSQERPVVGQAAYNTAFGETWGVAATAAAGPANYADIYTGSLKQPVFNYVPGAPNVGGFNSVKVDKIGAGYVTAPAITFQDPSVGVETGAIAQSTLKISDIQITDGGSGYTIAPLVSIVAQAGGGSGAMADARLAVDQVIITNGGAGYTSAPTVLFSAPTAGGVRATGTAVVSGGRVIGVTLTEPGSGYAAAPTVSFQGGGATTTARATTTGHVSSVHLIAPDPMSPIVRDAAGVITDLGSAGGGGYTDLSQVAITFNGGVAPAGGTAATATATGSLFDITMVNHGTGYTGNTVVTVGGNLGATAQVDTYLNGLPTGSNLVKTKAIHELFEPTFGRMNAILAVEIPFTSALTQTTIPLAMIDPPTEEFSDGETQIWKITHNGVDTHPVHFHLLNVQLINRVGWDGWISPPTAAEVGWKETIKMNPLEDVVVAVRAKRPPLPGFGVPNSIRPMDPSQPLGSPFGFTQIDPNSGVPKAIVNDTYNFGWEYVWHCHILGHEENDFMRPIVFHANEAAPLAPATLSVRSGGTVLNNNVAANTPVTEIRWADQAQTEYQYLVERSVNNGAWEPLGTALANATSYTLPAGTSLAAGTTMKFRVTAVGANGTAASEVTVASPPANTLPAPTGLVSLGVTGTQNGRPRVTLNWVDASLGETVFDVYRKVTGSAQPAILVGSVNTASTTTTGRVNAFVDGNQNSAALRPAFGTSYDYTVLARKTTAPTASSASSASLTVSIGATGNAFGTATLTLGTVNAIRQATTGVNADRDTVILNWAEEATNSNTVYSVQYRTCAVPNAQPTQCRVPFTWGPWRTAALGTAGSAANSTGASFVITGQRVHTVQPGQTLPGAPAQFQIRAQNAIGNGGWSTPATDIVLP